MTEKEYVLYDFKQAGSADDTAVAFRAWVAKASQIFGDNWNELSNLDIRLSGNEIRTQSFASVMDPVANTSIGCVSDIESGKLISLWHVSREDVFKILNSMMGQMNEEEAEAPDRALTHIEFSVCELFFEYLAKAFGEGWPNKEAIECTVSQVESNPKRLRLFRGNDLVSVSKLTVQLADAEIAVQWVLPKQETSELLETFVEKRAIQKPEVDPEAMVDPIPLEVVAVLGQAQVPMHRLAELAVGDVVVLDQKINRPVSASINGKTFYECWPGKIGNSQGLEIESCL